MQKSEDISFQLSVFQFSVFSGLMATIHIARNQQTLGSFGEEEVREGIRTGRFLAADLVWREGMESWKPLGEMAPQWGLETPPPLLNSASEISPPLEVLNDGHEPAWEEREKLGFFPTISQTVSAVLMRPAETFASLKKEGGLLNPLLYFVILSTAAFTVSVFYQMVAYSVNPSGVAPQFQSVPKGTVMVVMLGMIFISPALYVLSSFITSGIIHLLLKLFGGANRPFETTFRVICYAQASAAVFNFLPLCGGLMAILWGIYALVIGLKAAHGTQAWRTALAVLFPWILCCGLGFFIMAIGIAQLAQMHH